MGISLPLAQLKAGLKKIRREAKLTFKRGPLQSSLLYFGACFTGLFVLLTVGLGLAAKYPWHGSKTLFLAFFAESAGPKDSSAAFLEASPTFLREPPELLLTGGSSAVLAASAPLVVTSQTLGALFLTSDPQDRGKVITEYIVEAGDTLSSLAEEFNVSVDTLLWANNLSKGQVLKVGQRLIVPPISGVVHHVKDKDTISSIAKTYKANSEEIIAFNELTGDAIYIGDILVIPGGQMPPPKQREQYQTTPLADSYFICPTASCRKSQGLHWYNAIDFSGSCGDQIRAAAQGIVLKVALTSSTSKYAFGGAGNHVTILHPNGVVTTYGHISASLVSPGQTVSQGQTIALMGGQRGTPGAGLSTGCHVHFGVSGARNPF